MNKIKFTDKIKAYLDLSRAHFAIVWPLLFCSGLMLAFRNYDGFSWSLLIRVALIGLFGFEAGMIWNDILDHKIDQIEPDETMTNYWRPFKERPIPSGKISILEASILCGIFLAIAIGLIATIPFPNYLYVYGIMIYAYLVETFYNLKKRNQKFPFAQLLGRTDLTIFPVAGYLCLGQPDKFVFLYMLLLYPWALAHLATNDIIDVENDRAKDLKTITVLFGEQGNILWISLFTLAHILAIPLFLLFGEMSYIALGGFILSSLVLIAANVLLIKRKTPKTRMLTLPMFHGTLFIITSSIIVDSAILPDLALLAI